MIADCKPLAAAQSIAAAATTVFPLPTSPWRSLLIATEEFISSSTSLRADVCPDVKTNGRDETKSVTISLDGRGMEALSSFHSLFLF